MIFRAVFWIGLVSLLMPHEPDLGLGRPGAGALLPSRISSLATPSLPKLGEACSAACAGGLGVLDMLQNMTVQSLAQVKAEIDQSVASRNRTAL